MARSPEQRELDENRARLNAQLSWKRIDGMKAAWALVKEHDIADPSDPDAYFAVTKHNYKEVFRILEMEPPDVPDDIEMAVLQEYPSIGGGRTYAGGKDYKMEEVTAESVDADEWAAIEARRAELPPD